MHALRRLRMLLFSPALCLAARPLLMPVFFFFFFFFSGDARSPGLSPPAAQLSRAAD